MRSLRVFPTIAATFLSLSATAASYSNAQSISTAVSNGSCKWNPFEQPFSVPEMASLPDEPSPFQYIEVGAEIPNYVKAAQWGQQGDPISTMQSPLPPDQAIRRIVTPKGFRVELFASEPDLQGKPICMAWDERGRLWIGETLDYPNEYVAEGQGRDRIRICEDTNGDGKADRFTIFADGLSIPTAIAFHEGGAIVQNGTETIYLKDTDGDDVADIRKTLVTGWQLNDTHGGVSNFQYGLDNWIWAMQGYNNSSPIALGVPQQSFRMGFFRFRPDGSEVEFIRSTNNNTWGLGFSEEGLVFGSTANGNPSVFMPIANRYYEKVRGWRTSLTLSSIADSNRFLPITDRVRQVDHFGGFTAAAGHSLYTARQYPAEYWNRVALVCEPTGHLVASFVLSQDGSGFRSSNPFNLFASDDEWSAPIMAEVGPDGNVWVADWYNFIVQHNPTPKGFETGPGNAYETRLRDKKHGRIYRIVYERADPIGVTDLSQSGPADLVKALRHSVMGVRKHAQRLLVERGESDVATLLVEMIRDTSCDSVGLNVGAIHALWTLKGLGLIAEPTQDHTGQPATVTRAEILDAVWNALRHPSPGVRRNALQVLPNSVESTERVLAAKLHMDPNPNVRLAAILALADLPVAEQTSSAILETLSVGLDRQDRWLTDAAVCGAAKSDFQFLVEVTRLESVSETLDEVARIVAEHFARGGPASNLPKLLKALSNANEQAVEPIAAGLVAGWPDDLQVALESADEQILVALAERASPEVQGLWIQLAGRWGTQCLANTSQQVGWRLIERVRSDQLTDDERTQAARQAIQLRVDDEEIVDQLLDTISPRLSPELCQAVVAALEGSQCRSLGSKLVQRMSVFLPAARGSAISLLLQRSELTRSLLDGIENGTISLSELALDQRQALSGHPVAEIRQKARQLFERGGTLPSPDRQKVLDELAFVATQPGNVTAGKAVFQQHCAKCHLHGGQGAEIGPDLTGMAVHPKEEMLVHILDPNRSVENNFRAYSLLTVDGLVLTGMLAAESRTAVELFDTEGRRRTVLREDIEQLVAMPQSIMPEGFEKSISPAEMSDLLEFLVAPERFIPLDLSRVATVASDRGMFFQPEGPERLLFDDWTPKLFKGVPFRLIEPRDGRIPNVVLLHGPLGGLTQQMPHSVSLVCHSYVKAIHLLGGVAGWGYPLGEPEEVSLRIRLGYSDGVTEDHDLLNGVHIADYIRRIDVPGSEFAFDLNGKQLRYLSVEPRRSEGLESIQLIKVAGGTAPLVMAITVETLSP
jgi:uncharacterized protein